MSRWARGEGEVEHALERGELQMVSGAAADGSQLLERAARTLVSARAVVELDPDSAYVLAYDAARYSATALLEQQGLRPTTSGGHLVVQDVMRAQFSPVFKTFATLRRRRNELEYPSGPGETTSIEEARKAIGDAEDMQESARQLLPSLGSF